MSNRLWPSVPPHYFNVLGHFHVTHIWPVKDPLTHWMVRFERVDLVSKPWWAPVHSTDEYKVGEYVCPSRICMKCSQPSNEIYKAGWTCLNDTCTEFSKFDTSAANGQIQLDYTESFLRERTPFQPSGPLIPLMPDLPIASHDNTFGTGKASRGGIVCPKCHGCSRRLKWECWECETEGCNFQHTIPFSLMTPQDVEAEQQAFRSKPYINESIVSQYYEDISGYKAEIYYLMGEKEGEVAGGVTIFRATRDICKKPRGPDELFEELQQADICLRRNSALHPS